jgi:5-methylcytosine-specific restriction protein A
MGSDSIFPLPDVAVRESMHFITRGEVIMSNYSKMWRQNEGYAAAIFENLWPDTRIRRSVAQLLADFIRHASDGTTAWVVVLDHDVVKLDVGPVLLLRLEAQNIWFCAKKPITGRPRWVHEEPGTGYSVYKSVPISSVGLYMSPARLTSLPKTLRHAALEYVQEAASHRKGKSSWTRAHSPGVIGFLERYLRTNLPGGYDGSLANEEVPSLLEGDTVIATIRGKKRSHIARELCIRHHGYRCAACDTKLAEVYGPIAQFLIHVHHLHPLAEAEGKRRVNPIEDLRPVCPNCHAVAHTNIPQLAIQDVRALIAKNK